MLGSRAEAMQESTVMSGEILTSPAMHRDRGEHAQIRSHAALNIHSVQPPRLAGKR